MATRWATTSTRPPTVGTLGRQNRHTRILRSPLHAVSTTGKKAMSQGFQRRTIGGPSPASGRPRADPGALSATHREADGDLGDRLVCPRPGTSPVVSLMHADVLVWLEDPGGSAAPPSIPDLWLRRNSPPRGPTRWISGSWSPSAKKSALTASESLLSACRGRGMGEPPGSRPTGASGAPAIVALTASEGRDRSLRASRSLRFCVFLPYTQRVTRLTTFGHTM